MLNRRKFLTVASTSLAIALRQNSRIACADEVATGIDVSSIEDGEDIFDFIQRHHGRFDIRLYQKILGTANEFKEGDAIVGVAAIDDRSRLHAKELLANTRLRDIEAHPPWEDDLSRWIDRFAPKEKRDDLGRQTLGEFKAWLLSADESDIPTVLPGLTSDIIACLVRLMSNDELIAIGQKVFHPLHGSQIGAKGYLGARVQPNSPTDHLDDIRFQVFDAFAYAVGDVLLGTNPVSSDPASVRLERTTPRMQEWTR